MKKLFPVLALVLMLKVWWGIDSKKISGILLSSSAQTGQRVDVGTEHDDVKYSLVLTVRREDGTIVGIPSSKIFKSEWVDIKG